MGKMVLKINRQHYVDKLRCHPANDCHICVTTAPSSIDIFANIFTLQACCWQLIMLCFIEFLFYREIAEEEVLHLFTGSDDDHDNKLSFNEILEHYDIFVGSEATDYGDHLHNIHHFEDEL